MKAIIFDMDGVLIDSPKYITIAFNKILSRFNVELTTEYRKKTIGRSLKDQIKLWEKDFGIKNIILEDFSKEAFNIEKELMKELLLPNKDVLQIISSAKDNGYKIGVATSSTSGRAKDILKKIKIWDLLDTFISANDVKKHKPDPEIFLKCAKELGVSPKNCIVFEDAISGVAAAQNADMKVVVLLTEYTEKQNFKNVDKIIKDFSQINIETIDSILNQTTPPSPTSAIS